MQDKLTHPTKRDRLSPGSIRPYVVSSEDSKMGIRADMRAVGAVTANETRASVRWAGSGTKSGECVSIFPDGSRIPFTRTRATNPSTRLLAVKTAKVDNAKSYADRLRMFGADGDQNH